MNRGGSYPRGRREPGGPCRTQGWQRPTCSENWASRPQLTETYEGLGARTILLAVVLKIVEDLGTRYYRRQVSEKGDGVS